MSNDFDYDAANKRIADAIEASLSNTQDRGTFRMYLIARRDLRMSAGKLAAQAGHAFLNCGLRFIKASLENNDIFAEYKRSGETKIVLGVDTLGELVRLRDLAVANGIITATVMDEGRTQFNGVPTITCCALGVTRRRDMPREFEKLDLY